MTDEKEKVPKWNFQTEIGDEITKKWESSYVKVVEISNLISRRALKEGLWIALKPEDALKFEKSTKGIQMTDTELIEILQEDLKNERKHMGFYLHSAVMVRGLHRHEIGELLLDEARDEFKHVEEFSRLIVQLGGIPGQEVNPFPTDLTCPHDILKYAQEMEEEVAKNYASRLATIGVESGCHKASFVNLFYEDQLQDSQKTAFELSLMLQKHQN